MRKVFALGALALFCANSSASESFATLKAKILDQMSANYGSARNLNLNTVQSLRQLPEELGLVDISSSGAYGMLGQEGEGGGQNGTAVMLKENSVRVENTAPEYQGAVSTIFCPQESMGGINELRDANKSESLWSKIDSQCVEVYIFSNIGGERTLDSTSYAYSFDLQTQKIKMDEPATKLIKVYVLDRSKGERAEGYEGSNPFLGERTDKNPDFALAEQVTIGRKEVLEHLMGQLKRIFDNSFYREADGGSSGQQKVIEGSIEMSKLSSESKGLLKTMAAKTLNEAVTNTAFIRMYNEKYPNDGATNIDQVEKQTEEGRKHIAARVDLIKAQDAALKNLSERNETVELAKTLGRIHKALNISGAL